MPNKLQRAQTNLKNEVTLVSTKNQCAVLIVNGNSFSLKLNDQGVDAKAGSANAMRKSNQSKSFPRLYFLLL